MVMDNTNKTLTVLLIASVLAVGGFLYFANGVTGLATANVESGFECDVRDKEVVSFFNSD